MLKGFKKKIELSQKSLTIPLPTNNSLKANKFQSGYIYQYAFVMLLGFSALLTFLIVK